MKTIEFGKTGLRVPVIAIGCMRMNGLSVKEAGHFIQTALEHGANFFDHADIYGGGACEELFAKAAPMRASEREKLLLQSKCGIRKGFYDFSKEHILSSVDASLKRLCTDYLDVLLLHRPDALMEPEEVAEAFDCLERAGKVRCFGVSNQNPSQMELLRKYVRQPIAANQLQFGVMHSHMVDRGIHVNMLEEAGLDRDGGVLDYCRLHDITIQPWSPFQYGFFEGVFLDNEKFPEVNRVLKKIGASRGADSLAVATAWILRHPAHMQPVIGTMNTGRLLSILKAADMSISREEWYEIYRAAGHTLP